MNTQNSNDVSIYIASEKETGAFVTIALNTFMPSCRNNDIPFSVTFLPNGEECDAIKDNVFTGYLLLNHSGGLQKDSEFTITFSKEEKSYKAVIQLADRDSPFPAIHTTSFNELLQMVKNKISTMLTVGKDSKTAEQLAST